MPTLDDIRTQYPVYKDVPDDTLADNLYNKYYANVPREEFNKAVGYSPSVITDAVKTAPGVIGNFRDYVATTPFDVGEMATRGVQWMAKNARPDLANAAENLHPPWAVGGGFPLDSAAPDTGMGKAVSGALDPVANFFKSQGHAALKAQQEQDSRAEAKAAGTQYIPPYEPQTLPVKMGQGALNMGAASLSTGGLSNIASVIRALAAGATSEGLGELAKRYLPSWAELPARLGGAVVGGLTPAGARKTIGPARNTDASRELAAKDLEAAGVNLTPADITGKRGGFEGAIDVPSNASREAQAVQLQTHVMRETGSPHPKPDTPVTATGEAIPAGAIVGGERGNALGHQGGVLRKSYGDFFHNTEVLYDPAKLKAELDPIVAGFEGSATRTNIPKTVREARNDIVYGKPGVENPKWDTRGMNGDRYLYMKDSLESKIAAAKGVEKGALIEIKRVLDNTFKESLPSDKLQALETLNNRYGNYKIAKEAVGEGLAITPKSLASAARSNLGDRYVEGGGPTVANAARASEKILAGPRATPKSYIPNSITGIGASLGAFLPGLLHGGFHYDPTSAILGSMEAAPLAAGAATTIKPMLRSLYYPANRLLRNSPGIEAAFASPDKQALIRLLGQTGITLPPNQPSQK